MRTDGLAADDDVSMVKIRILNKRVARSSRRIGGVGPIIEVTPFDEFGNRIFSMRGHDGRIDVVQGITEITPTLHQSRRTAGQKRLRVGYAYQHRFDSAGHTHKILLRHIDQTDPDDRLRVVKLYIQAERYRDALEELDRVIEDFPDMKELEKERTRLYQLVITDLIREIELRRDAGQYRLAHSAVDEFSREGCGG